MKKASILCALLALLAMQVSAQDHECSSEDLKAEVPALSAFHEVIQPLWHDAWPNKNYGLVKELLPQLQSHVTAVAAAKLPGILRDKQSKWEAGVNKVKSTLADREKSVSGNDEQGMLDAVEEIHSDFEQLVRIVRPRMKELEAYHVLLYQVYHYYMPGKNYDKLRDAAAEMAGKSEALLAAKTPRRIEAKDAQFKSAVKELHAATKALAEAVKGNDTAAIDAAVEEAHTKYVDVEHMFD